MNTVMEGGRNYLADHLLYARYYVKHYLDDYFSQLQKSYDRGFLGGSVVRNLPANAGDTVRVLVWEDPTCGGATEPVHHNH